MRTASDIGAQLSYSEDTTDLARRGIMGRTETAPGASQTRMTLTVGRFVLKPEIAP
jgi:hypothetical protein